MSRNRLSILARSQVFSENTFGGIINGKRDIHLFEDYLFVLPRKSKFVQYYIEDLIIFY